MAMEMHSRPPLVGAPAPAPAMVTAPNMGVHALSPQHGATAPYNGLGGQLGTALPTHGAALGARQAPVGSPSPAIVGGLPGDAGARLPPVGAAELTLPTEPTQNDVATTEPGKMFVGGLSPETTRGESMRLCTVTCASLYMFCLLSTASDFNWSCTVPLHRC
eukprot:m.19688 g.19688  ORF g.19688 m.19688 type:complete len:162 (+) comp8067_c0_seq1:359-844(+)